MNKFKWQNIALILLFSASVFGQLLRVMVFSRIALTASDIVLIIVGLGLVVYVTYRRLWLTAIKYTFTHPVWRYLILFVIWALISLLINASRYNSAELFASFSYWARLALLVTVTIGLSYAVSDKDDKRVLSYYLLFSLIAVALGFVQLYFLPDLGILADQGWDPHIGRLVSSFLDPNFFAVYIVILMVFLLGKTMEVRQRSLLWLFFIISWLALYLTYSRSGWLIGFLALPLTIWTKSRKLAVVIALIFIVVVFLPGRLGERIRQADSFVNTSAVQTAGGDASAAARAISSKKALELVQGNWIVGVGYNGFGFAMVEEGLLPADQLNVRSAMGTDNSFLFVLATTGVIGLGLFLWFYISLLVHLWHNRTRSEAWQLFCLGVAIAIGSIFNNIMFYIPILITWWALVAWVVKTDE